MTNFVDDIAAELYQAKSAAKEMPLPSDLASLDLDSAYQIQRRYVELILADDTIAGYKGALSTPAALAAFGFDEPIFGMLFGSGAIKEDSAVDGSAYRSPILETEIGFVMAANVDQPIDDVADVDDLISACMPMIELPNINFGAQRPTGLDLVAANAASQDYIVGKQSEPGSWDLNDIRVQFSCNGELLHEALAGEVMNDQRQALMWLINAVLGRGQPISKGQILMTGSIGAPQPGKPGDYLADYGPFGRIAFSIV